MNLLLDFDVVNAIKDINEGYTPMKIIRNEGKYIALLGMPSLFALNYLVFGSDVFKEFPAAVVRYFIIYFGISLAERLIGGDRYKGYADTNLRYLVYQLNQLDTKLDYEMMKEAKCYHRVFNVKLNENKIPEIIESKYILIPVYGLDGEIIEESFLQEHVVGSKAYVLSKGSPTKELKPALSQI